MNVFAGLLKQNFYYAGHCPMPGVYLQLTFKKLEQFPLSSAAGEDPTQLGPFAASPVIKTGS